VAYGDVGSQAGACTKGSDTHGYKLCKKGVAFKHYHNPFSQLHCLTWYLEESGDSFVT